MIGICSVEVRAVPPSFLAYNERFHNQRKKLRLVNGLYNKCDRRKNSSKKIGLRLSMDTHDES